MPSVEESLKVIKRGVEEILPYGALSAFEEKAKNDMLDTLNNDIKEGVDFINS